MAEAVIPGINKITLPVTGMTCAACVVHVSAALEKLPEVLETDVNLTTEKATISLTDEFASIHLISDTLKKAGYGLASRSVILSIGKMTCAACVSHVETGISSVNGVLSCSVNLATEKATVTYIPEITSTFEITNAVEKTGYTAERIDSDDYSYGETSSETRILTKKIALGGFTSVLIALTNIFPSLKEVGDINPQYIFLAMATGVQFWSGSHFYISSWSALKLKTTNMNTLVVLGTTVAYLYSLVITITEAIGIDFGDGQTHYSASSSIITLVLVGRLLETKARKKASNSIKSLLNLSPKIARVIRSTEVEIPREELIVGDKIIVRPGESFPTDGLIYEGRGTVDESMLTGESIPAIKEKGSYVFGSTVNGTSTFQYTATKVGKDTLHSKIIKLVEEAQNSKAPIQRLADQISGIFVPVVLLIALLTFCAWFIFEPSRSLNTAMITTVAVLVIACPCAMGLATPTAIVVGTGRGATMGILFRNAQSLETSQKIDTVVFDKTGTLTYGTPRIESIQEVELTRSEILKYAGSVSLRSEHVLAKSIAENAFQESVKLSTPEDFQAHPGMGSIAKVDGKTVAIGNRAFLLDMGLAVDSETNESTETLVMVNDELAGVINFTDEPRKEAKKSIELLKKMGMTVVLLSGDNLTVANKTASLVGISEVEAEALPDQKLEYIKNLQSKGKVVAMVGDGINDAPALAQSDIGISMGGGTDAAIEAGDITLVREDLRTLPEAVSLSRVTMRKIKQNLFWAFAYNIFLIPVAAGLLHLILGTDGPISLTPLVNSDGFMNPIAASCAMALSSICVVLNSILLRKVRL